MATATMTPPPPARTGGGLRRDIGLVGMIWASEGSIIGSGWLFGALFAAQAAGTAAIISWLIGAVAIIVLAFVHAELGAAYPVAGGTGRFPHYAFGTLAGASFGWFSWLQAVTVAPISWQGGYCSTGPASSVSCGATGHLGLWWDMLVIGVFSLGIYYWARAVRLPQARTQEYIEAQHVPAG